MSIASAEHPSSSSATPAWTAEAEALVVRLFLVEGLSAAEVAAVLGGGVTRAAVLSKVRRLGFRKRDLRRAGVIAGPRATPNAERRRIERRLPPQRPPVPLPPLRDSVATGVPTTLARLPLRACRWPIDDPGAGRMHETLFCAGPADGGLYCAVHAALARPASGTAK